MQPPDHRRASKFLPIGAGTLLLLVLFWNTATLQKKEEATLAAVAASVAVSAEAQPIEQKQYISPVRLIIPAISVDADIESVGLTPDGAMDVPKERASAAWFNRGPRPGEDGSAVINGHYGWKDGKASVFDTLHTLRAGDTIYVRDSIGDTTAFVVRELTYYNPKADASSVFNSDDGTAHLNLITCEGVWNAVSKSYSQRLVVFADKMLTAEIPVGQESVMR